MLTRETIMDDPKGALLTWAEEVREAGKHGSLAVSAKVDEFKAAVEEMHPEPEPPFKAEDVVEPVVAGPVTTEPITTGEPIIIPPAAPVTPVEPPVVSLPSEPV